MVRLEHSQMKITETSGPLPDPDTLRKYNELVPGAAERFLSSFEREQLHRHDMERQEIGIAIKHVNGIMYRSWGGLLAAFLISVFALGVAYQLAIQGITAVASIIAGTTIVSLAFAFLGGKKADDKAKAMAELAERPDKR